MGPVSLDGPANEIKGTEATDFSLTPICIYMYVCVYMFSWHAIASCKN